MPQTQFVKHIGVGGGQVCHSILAQDQALVHGLVYNAAGHLFIGAYRFETGFDKEILVKGEELNIRFPNDPEIWFPKEESLMSHFERVYQYSRLSEIADEEFCSLPVLLRTDAGSSVLITEADLYDYPGLFLEKQADGFISKFPPAVLEAS